MQVGHRHAPPRHAALRIGFGGAPERFLGLGVPERVQQGVGAVDFLLRRFVARRRQMRFADVPKIDLVFVFVFVGQ